MVWTFLLRIYMKRHKYHNLTIISVAYYNQKDGFVWGDTKKIKDLLEYVKSGYIKHYVDNKYIITQKGLVLYAINNFLKVYYNSDLKNLDNNVKKIIIDNFDKDLYESIFKDMVNSKYSLNPILTFIKENQDAQF